MLYSSRIAVIFVRKPAPESWLTSSGEDEEAAAARLVRRAPCPARRAIYALFLALNFKFYRPPPPDRRIVLSFVSAFVLSVVPRRINLVAGHVKTTPGICI